MQLDTKKYVPILKWKRAEQGALSELRSDRKESILPLIELVMPKPKSSLKDTAIDDLYAEVINIFRSKRLLDIPNEILSSWGNPIMVDFNLLYPEVKLEAVRHIIPETIRLGVPVIPVVSMNDDNTFKQAIIDIQMAHRSSLCLRILSSDLEDIDQLNSRLTNYLKLPKTNTTTTYLLIDLKDLQDPSEYKRLLNISQNITRLNEWKGFIFSSGAFPVDLSECKIDKDNYLPRSDWTNWEKSNAQNLLRKPTYSDYAIRHPIYIESYQFREPTSSVKYTLEDSWLVIKGKIRKYELFLAAAALLVNTDGFLGEDFSSGDKYVAEKARHYPVYMKNPKVKGTGTTELWLKAGLNHHLSLVSDRVSKKS